MSALLIAGSGLRSQGRMVPVDEAALDAGFFTFRAALAAAVAARDVPAVVESLAPDVWSGVGETNTRGIERFRAKYELDLLDAPFWRDFASVLARGGRFETAERFRAPYVSANWPQDLDILEHAAIVGENVRIRVAPAIDAPVMGTLSFAIVRLNDGVTDRQGWTGVVYQGRRGFVATRFLETAAGYRATFIRVAGSWLVEGFVAGD